MVKVLFEVYIVFFEVIYRKKPVPAQMIVMIQTLKTEAITMGANVIPQLVTI